MFEESLNIWRIMAFNEAKNNNNNNGLYVGNIHDFPDLLDKNKNKNIKKNKRKKYTPKTITGYKKLRSSSICAYIHRIAVILYKG